MRSVEPPPIKSGQIDEKTCLKPIIYSKNHFAPPHQLLGSLTPSFIKTRDMTRQTPEQANLKIATHFLERMISVWGISKSQWIERRHIPDIVETFEYLNATTGIPKGKLIEILGVPASRYYAWQKEYHSPDFEAERSRPKSLNRLLPEEEKAILDLHLSAPFLDPERMSSFLQWRETRYVSSSVIRNLLNSEGKKILPTKGYSFQMPIVNETVLPIRPMQKWLQVPIYITTPDSNSYILRVNIDLFSNMAFTPCLYLDTDDQNSFDQMTNEIFKNSEVKPEMVKNDIHLSGINELSLFLATHKYKLSKQNPALFTFHRSFNALAGAMVRHQMNEDAKSKLESYKSAIKQLINEYNAKWPIKSRGYLPPNENILGQAHMDSLVESRIYHLGLAKDERRHRNRAQDNQPEHVGIQN